jgi:leucyl aminopeptidase
MLKIKFFSKKFSQLAKITFTKKSNDMKNVIYFATEGEMKSNSNEVIKLVNFEQPIIKNDIEKNKFAMVYSFPNNPYFSERLIYSESPKNDLEKTRKMAAKALRAFSACKLEVLHVLFSENFPLENRKIALNSIIMANYNYKITGKIKNLKKEKVNKEKDEKDEKNEGENSSESNVLKEIKVVNDEIINNNLEDFKMYASLANANLYTRELANMRPNFSSCDYMEEVARSISKGNSKIKIEVIKGDDLLKNNLNLIHAVGKAAESEPRMVILSYKGLPQDKNISHAIVGKGLTFDTGGLNLKPTNYIEDMYLDKHGACNVLAAFKYAVDWNLPMNLVCAIGLADNAIDGLSYKPSDIITSHKGLTVEITNTDAEGRLVLVDVLSYLQEKYKPKNIIDLATLTGACMVALVNKYMNKRKFYKKIKYNNLIIFLLIF